MNAVTCSLRHRENVLHDLGGLLNVLKGEVSLQVSGVLKRDGVHGNAALETIA